jgi:hypothetical protein
MSKARRTHWKEGELVQDFIVKARRTGTGKAEDNIKMKLVW